MVPDLNRLSREDLIALIQMYAKNWLAHDGCWFLAIEKAYGFQKAIELDTESWCSFTAIEARRIMDTMSIPKNGGLDSLAKALDYRLYASVNHQKIERVSEDRLIFKMLDCRVQSTRRCKGFLDFPCKPVGLVEYGGFADAVDPRIQTRCLGCPPDVPREDFYCAWEFTIRELGYQ